MSKKSELWPLLIMYPPEHEVPVLPVPEAPAVVLHHLHAEPAELVVEEHVHQVELHHQADEVQGLTWEVYFE